jgi:anti-sigma factor RsiW
MTRSSDDPLLAAYCDGVAELSVDERRRVEALLDSTPALRTEAAATRSLLDQLRELPAEGTEPDWAKLANAINAEVGPHVPRRWWLGGIWRWLLPLTTVGVATAIILLLVRSPSSSSGGEAPAGGATATETVAARSPVDAGAEGERVAELGEATSIWLDGQEVEIDSDAAAMLDDVDAAILAQDERSVEGLLSTADLGWIDELDSAEIGVMDDWLEQTARDQRKKKT